MHVNICPIPLGEASRWMYIRLHVTFAFFKTGKHHADMDRELALALLAGCSLPASLVPGEPNLSKTTTKAPKDYAACLLPLWQQDIPKTTQTAISNGYRITAPSIVTADEILDIIKYKDGSRVSCIRDRPGPSPGRCANRCVTACKARQLQNPPPEKQKPEQRFLLFCFVNLRNAL
jgi:hypothetical protein